MITSFDGEYKPLSNFWYKPVLLEGIAFVDGTIYATNEHAYQAAKTLDFGRRIEIAAADTPGKAKRLGNHKNTIIRPDWSGVKREIMLDLIRQKFSYTDMEYLLLSTGNQKLVEGNTWHDNYWGICSCEMCNGVGKNWLGKLLMFVRMEIQIAKGIEC